ncbi:hypothetical protein THRCLA_07765 [Thraustotheca clavata]|uniref:PrsW family intramembrane metalloprotease n=1 Tax=Thraustotheca clavata TaxID=74557 RepID=A0A1V9ZC43_9STRA|nr:hypothetical protein THRCLA_07765 [Thraustotheca clavata]
MPALSLVSRGILALVLLVLPIYLVVMAPLKLLLLLVLYVPPLILFGCTYLYAKRLATKLNWEMLFRVFFGGFFPGVVLAIVAESLLTFLFFFVFLGSDSKEILQEYQEYGHAHPNATAGEILSHLNFRQTFGFFLFIFSLAFVVAGVVEEYIKYWLVKGKCCVASGLCTPFTSPHVVDPFYTILCFAAAGCGFATCENVGYVFIQTGFSNQIQTAIARSLLATPLHVLCTCMTGMNIVSIELNRAHQQELLERSYLEKALTTFRCLLPAIIFHGVYDFQAFICSIFLPNWPHASILVGAICILLGANYVHQVYSFINWDYQVLDFDDAALNAMEHGEEIDNLQVQAN